jgi:hypothetical protein
MKSPFAQPEKSRVANVIIAKSSVLAAQVLRNLSRKGFGAATPIANHARAGSRHIFTPKYVMTTLQTNKYKSSCDDGLIHQVSQVIARRMIKLQQ